METKENIKEILEKIQEAEYVLVGLGQYLICSIFYPCRRGIGK
jgi:lipoate synthase